MYESDSESDIAAVDDGEEDTRGAAGKEEEEGELKPARVREQLLDFLDELSSVETSSDEEDAKGVTRRQYHHLPWRSRCWRVSLLIVGVACCTMGGACRDLGVVMCVGSLHLHT